MATAMGGRLAEEIKFGVDKVTSGAINDFKQATRIATEMVARLGTYFILLPHPLPLHYNNKDSNTS